MGLVRKLRSVRLRFVVAASALISLGIVLGSIPGRWEGSRTATNAFVPLRPLTTAEVAALLEDAASGSREHTAITELGASEVEIQTVVYPFRLDCASSRPTILADGACYGLSETSWEGYASRYRLDRAALEAALGRGLEERDVHVEAFTRNGVSFDPDHLSIYALAETLLLTAFGWAHFLILVRVRRPLGALPVVLGVWLFFFFAVTAYAPALLDADWFFQRIVVERIALALVVAAVLAMPVAALSALLYALFRAVDWWAVGDRVRRWKLRAMAIGVVAALLALDLAWDYWRYRETAASCADLLQRVRAQATPERIGILLAAEEVRAAPIHRDFLRGPHLSEEAHATIQALLAPAREAPKLSLELYAEIGPSRHLFLWATPSHDYADVRPLGSQINQRQIDRALEAGGQVDASFPSYLTTWHTCALRANDLPAQVVIVAGEGDLGLGRRWTPGRILVGTWSALFGRAER